MGSIQSTRDEVLDLTVHVARGRLLYDDLLDWVSRCYSEMDTSLSLWDFTEAEVSGITTPEFRNLAREMKKRPSARTRGKTALVFAGNGGFGLGRMFAAFSEMEQLPSQYRSFRSMSEARRWLGI